MMSTTGKARNAIPLLLCLMTVSIAAACVQHPPSEPPLRDVKTEEDQLFLWCVGQGIYRAAPQCRKYVSARHR